MLNFESLVEEEYVGEHSPFDQAQRSALQELADLLFEVGTDSGPNPMIAAAIGQSIDQQTRGLVDDAIESLRQAIDAGLSRTAAFFDLGALYYERGHHDNAIESFRHSMRDKEYTLGSHYGLGLTYHAGGNVDQALEHFIEVARIVDLENASPELHQPFLIAVKVVGRHDHSPRRDRARFRDIACLHRASTDFQKR
ncbi:MAG: hypothetical protein H8E35_05220, partial [Ardenticatenia bacterium]|nr:hypothetical protein [Ardenticatenia bacterium]